MRAGERPRGCAATFRAPTGPKGTLRVGRPEPTGCWGLNPQSGLSWHTAPAFPSPSPRLEFRSLRSPELGESRGSSPERRAWAPAKLAGPAEPGTEAGERGGRGAGRAAAGTRAKGSLSVEGAPRLYPRSGARLAGWSPGCGANSGAGQRMIHRWLKRWAFLEPSKPGV